MADPTFDPRRAEAFRERLRCVQDGAGLALMISIGHRTGLFDVMRRMPPAPGEAIAAQAGLAEPYVHEWLGAMASGGIVEHDPRTGGYRLPAEHAASLTRGARPHNRAAAFQWIPVLARVEDEIVECFERGGGLPPAAFGRLHAVLAEESEQAVVAVLLESILPLVPGASEALAGGIDVLEVGCGSGRALNRMAAAHRRSRFTGYDRSPAAVAAARAEARELGLCNVRFEAKDAADLDAEQAFDLVTAFGLLNDGVRPAAALRAVARALRPGGKLLVRQPAGASGRDGDRAAPPSPFLCALSCLHRTAVSLSAEGADVGDPWSVERALGEAGFRAVERRRLPHDAASEFVVARKGP